MGQWTHRGTLLLSVVSIRKTTYMVRSFILRLRCAISSGLPSLGQQLQDTSRKPQIGALCSPAMDEKNLESGIEPHLAGSDRANPRDLSPVSSKDLDETYEIYKRQDATSLDPVEARRVLRKIDLHIMPLLMGTYLLQVNYLDSPWARKSNLTLDSISTKLASTSPACMACRPGQS